MRRFFAVVLVSVAVAACGGAAPQQPSVDATKTLREGAAALASLHSVTATLKFTRGTVSFQGFALVSAKAGVRLPDESDTTYTVKDNDITLPIQVVITGGHTYVKVPFAPFEPASAADAALLPDLAKMFSPSTGLPAILPAGTGTKYVSTDQVDGVTAYQISTTYTAAQVHGMLPQLTSSGDVHARIWVDSGDHLIRKAVLDGTFGDGGKPAAVEVDLAGFNTAVTIASPTP